MGSFNVKCCLSGMEIQYGDPVVMLLGKLPGKLPYSGGYEAQGHKFQLLATPIFGTYNDYGWIEKVEPRSWEAAMACLDIMLPQGEEEDEPFWASIVPGEDRDTLLNDFCQHSWGMKEDQEQNATAWVHRTIWDAVVAVREDPWGEFNSMNGKGVFTPEGLEAFCASIGASAEFMTKYDDRYKDEEMHWFTIKGTSVHRFKIAQWFQDRIQGDPLGPLRDSLREAYSHLKESLGEEDFEDFINMRMELFSDDRHNHPMSYVISTKLPWFFPFWAHSSGRSKKADQDGKIKALLGLMVDYSEQFMAASTMYEKLIGGRMVVRPHGDMPSSAQGTESGVEYAFQAMAKGILEVSQARMSEYGEDEDEECC